MPVWSCALPSPAEPSPRVWRVIERIWAAMRADPVRAGPTLSAGLRAERALGGKERPVAGDVLTGLIRHERALARLHADPLQAWLRLCREGIPDLPDPAHALAVAASVPDWLGDEWERRHAEPVALVRTLAGRAPVVLRVLREPVEIPIPHRREGRAIILEGRTNLDLLPAYREGRVAVQDLGSQAIAEAAFPGAGRTVMDLCAGAGGKSLALAAMGAKVQAWDTRRDALRELDRRARKSRLAIRIAPPDGRYDVALIDAPCSGTGVLRRHPENRWKFAFPTVIQRELMTHARCISDRVVYATCALTLRENEEIVPGGTTLWPEVGGRDGFYVAEPC